MNRNRKIKSYTMHFNWSPEEIFPLLCPVVEYDWIEHWECEMIYTDSGVAELDCIFKTTHAEDTPETWVVCKYDPPNCIEFVRVSSIKAIRYTIELMQQDDGSTKVIWRQVITGLNDEGDKFVANYTDDNYNDMMSLLQRMINHYLETGEMLKVAK